MVPHRTERECSQTNRRYVVANNSTGYGRKWKKWLAIYAAVGAVAYLIIYFVFISGGSGPGGGGGLY